VEIRRDSFVEDKIDITGIIFLAIILWPIRYEVLDWILDKMDSIFHKFAEMMEPVMEDD
jgi:hypothetical protein